MHPNLIAAPTPTPTPLKRERRLALRRRRRGARRNGLPRGACDDARGVLATRGVAHAQGGFGAVDARRRWKRRDDGRWLVERCITVLGSGKGPGEGEGDVVGRGGETHSIGMSIELRSCVNAWYVYSIIWFPSVVWVGKKTLVTVPRCNITREGTQATERMNGRTARVAHTRKRKLVNYPPSSSTSAPSPPTNTDNRTVELLEHVVENDVPAPCLAEDALLEQGVLCEHV